jgi:hypothetical protein
MDLQRFEWLTLLPFFIWVCFLAYHFLQSLTFVPRRFSVSKWMENDRVNSLFPPPPTTSLSNYYWPTSGTLREWCVPFISIWLITVSTDFGDLQLLFHLEFGYQNRCKLSARTFSLIIINQIVFRFISHQVTPFLLCVCPYLPRSWLWCYVSCSNFLTT